MRCVDMHDHVSVQIKSRHQRWGNKKALMACLRPMHQWIRGGDYQTRLKAVRELHLDPFVLNVGPTGETLDHSALVQQSRSHVVQFLIKFASGFVEEGEVNNQKEALVVRQKPFGKDAALSTRGFKNVSPANLAITMASAYPLLVAELVAWKDVNDRNIAYPLTSLWPVKLVKRFLHFNTTYFDKWHEVLESYEDEGGEIHPEAEDEDDGEPVPSSESDDCDNVF